jgi:hypothetical protein
MVEHQETVCGGFHSQLRYGPHNPYPVMGSDHEPGFPSERVSLLGVLEALDDVSEGRNPPAMKC